MISGKVTEARTAVLPPVQEAEEVEERKELVEALWASAEKHADELVDLKLAVGDARSPVPLAVHALLRHSGRHE